MTASEDSQDAITCHCGTVRFVDVRRVGVGEDGWFAAYVVYAGEQRAGVIEYEQATEYFRFAPTDPRPGTPMLGDFEVDALMRRVGDWLASQDVAMH